MAFKMKGSPMARNFGIGSPLHDEDEKVVKGGVTPTVEVSGGDKTERRSDKFDRVKSTKGSGNTKTAKLAAEYGGTWSREGTTFLNQDGKNAKQVAVAQGQKKSQEKRDYITANTTKSSATPKKTEEQLARMKAADARILANRKKKKDTKDKETTRKKAAGIATGFSKSELAEQKRRKETSGNV